MKHSELDEEEVMNNLLDDLIRLSENLRDQADNIEKMVHSIESGDDSIDKLLSEYKKRNIEIEAFETAISKYED